MTFTHTSTLDDSAVWHFVPMRQDGLAAQLGEFITSYRLDITGLEEDFSAEAGKTHLIHAGKRRLVLLGLGDAPRFDKVLDVFRWAVHSRRKRLDGKLLVDWRFSDQADAFYEAAANGILLGTYTIGRYKGEPDAAHPLANIDYVLAEGQEAIAATATHRATVIAEGQLAMMDLVNAPSNHKTPAALVRFARESGEKYNYRVAVWEGEACAEMGLHALMAVNRGSELPAAFIVGHYKGANATQKVALVGKGVTFDTGGLSLKPSMNMHFMKSDMGGAAAVLGTIEAAARLQLPVELIAIVPSTDNSIDALATKPSEVFDSYSGKTIEMIDTDAEGRLILADGLAYAVKNYQPDILIDLATLTGSAVRTFGYAAAALFSNDDTLAEGLYKTGMRTGEKVWRLPIWDDYKDLISSDVADVRNFSGKPLAGAIAAAKFLEVFTDEHPRWAHLDIAGVAFGDSRYTKSKSATGYGIRLLIEWLEQESS